MFVRLQLCVAIFFATQALGMQIVVDMFDPFIVDGDYHVSEDTLKKFGIPHKPSWFDSQKLIITQTVILTDEVNNKIAEPINRLVINLVPHIGGTLTAHFSKSQARLVTVGSEDDMIKIWKVNRSRTPWTLELRHSMRNEFPQKILGAIFDDDSDYCIIVKHEDAKNAGTNIFKRWVLPRTSGL